MSGFMRLQVWQEVAVQSDALGTMVPESECEEPYNDSMPGLTLRWWGQYSAPGYMDRTDTCGPFETAEEAARETFALFGNDEPGSEDRRELASLLWQIRGAK